MTEKQEIKQRAIDMLRVQYRQQRQQVTDIDKRLGEYYQHLCDHSSVQEDDDDDLHNGDELLGALKFLRLLRTYPFDHEQVMDVIYKYEGEWRQTGKLWRHVRGGVKHPGMTGETYYRLQPFQVFILCAMFGPHVWINTHNEAGTRELLPTEEERDGMIYDRRMLCTEFTLYTPRKTAKTQLSAFVQFLYFMNGDQNAECYCCANASDQAKILFSRTKALIHQMDPREQRIRFTASVVNWKEGQFRSASLTALSAGGKTKDGTFAQLCSADEYGSAAYVNGQSDMGKLVSVIESSMGPRREPMTFISTTAGIIRQGPFIDKLAGIQQLLATELDRGTDTTTADVSKATLQNAEDRQMCLLLHPDAWEREREVLLTRLSIRRKINPMLGIVCQHAFYDDEIAKGRQNPEKMNEVISKLFNVYQVSVVQDWLKPEEMRRLQVARRIDDLHPVDGTHWQIFTGMDFSLGDDLYAHAYLCTNPALPYPRRFFADMDAWVTRDALEQSQFRVLYEQWERDGWLHVVDEPTIPPGVSLTRFDELVRSGCGIFRAIGYDPFASKIPINALRAYVMNMGALPDEMIFPCRQNNAQMNSPIDEMGFMIKSSEPWIEFSDNPMWAWEAGNAVVEIDRMENKRLTKRQQDTKIDNLAALMNAMQLFDMFDAQVQS